MGTNAGYGYVGVREKSSALDVARVGKIVFPDNTLTATGADEVEYTPANQLLSATTITIGADTDANGSGTIDFQTRTLTRLQITNAGNVSIVNKLGINQPVPTSPIHIKPTYPINVSSGERVIRFQPPNGIADFTFELSSTVFGGMTNTDDTMMWGWNIEQNAGEPRLHFAMEREFFGDFEVHLETDPTAAAIKRLWTWNINRATGAATHTMRADTTIISDGGKVFQVLATEIFAESPTRVRADSVTFETVNNGGAPDKQIFIVPYPADDERSWIQFGQVGGNAGVALVSGNGTLEVHGLNPTTDLKAVNAGSYIVNSTKVVGVQGAAVADATGAGDVVAQLNTLLARLRTHGLIAT